jgi:hypothetical protein
MASFDDVIVKSVLGSKTATILGLELEHVQSIVEIGAGGHLVSMSMTRRHSSKELKYCGGAIFPRPVDLQDSVLRPKCLSFHPAECGRPGTSGPCGWCNAAAAFSSASEIGRFVGSRAIITNHFELCVDISLGHTVGNNLAKLGSDQRDTKPDDPPPWENNDMNR